MLILKDFCYWTKTLALLKVACIFPLDFMMMIIIIVYFFVTSFTFYREC